MTHPFREDDDLFAEMFPTEAAREREKVKPTTAADDELTADILRQTHPGYGAMRDAAQAEQRQQERAAEPMSREELDAARLHVDMFGRRGMSEHELQQVDAANAADRHDRQLAEDGRQIEQQRERLADQSDRVREMQATLAEIERTVGRFDVGSA